MEEETQHSFSLGESIETSALLDDTTSAFMATKLGVDLDSEKALEERIRSFKKHQTEQVQTYLRESEQERNIRDHALYILNGWNNEGEKAQATMPLKQPLGGFFIRWNGFGIVLNPGVNFLENFHRQGLYIRDIHYVIVTQEGPEAASDLKKIYDLNYQLNKVSPELHVIHYYLNHKAYQELSHVLKPNFKQERGTVHSLELFLDSPDVELESLANGISLHYFSTASRGGYHGAGDYQEPSRGSLPSSVAVRLDLTHTGYGNHSSSPLRIGYLSGAAWSPLLAHHFGACDILLAGFGTTNPNDYGKLNYNENSLGYYGTYTLLEELRPALLLSSEFDGREGDIRLEITRKMRKEHQKVLGDQQEECVVLPADKGLVIDLEAKKVQCSVTGQLLDPKEVVVVKSLDTYGKLYYLSSSCVL